MSLDDPLVNGVPLSTLRVVDLKDELDKRGLSKIGNKSTLTERLKAYICENELQNCGENAEVEKIPEKDDKSAEKAEESPPKVASPGNPLVAAYLARQAEALENQKRDAERIRQETEGGAGDAQSKEDQRREENEEKSEDPEQSSQNSPRQLRGCSEPKEQAEESKTSQEASPRRLRKHSEPKELTEESKAPHETSPRRQRKHSESKDQIEPMKKKAAKDPLSENEEGAKTAKDAEVPDSGDPLKEPAPSPEKLEKTLEADYFMEEAKEEESKESLEHEQPEDKLSEEVEELSQPSQESQHSIDAQETAEKNFENKKNVKMERSSRSQKEAEDKKYEKMEEDDSRASTASKQAEENGSGGDHLEELDYGEAEVEAEQDTEEKETKDEVLELDDSEERELRREKRRIAASREGEAEYKDERKRKISPSRHPESDIVHIRGLTRPFTDRALKAEILKSGGQILDFWIDSVKSHCIVQMQSIDEAREVRFAMHNTQWPAANPKTLSVQFDTKENMERHRNGLSSAATSATTAPATRSERKPSDRERPIIGTLPGRNPSLKITVEAAMRENEKLEERKEKERREHARAEKDTESKPEKEKKDKSEERRHHDHDDKALSKKDDHDRKRRRSETPPFSRAAFEKRERHDSYQRIDKDRERDRDRYERRREDDRGRHRDERDEEKEKEREEKPVKTADSLFMKTKTLPAIYFLPLTDEEAAERQERLMEEKKKRELREQEREKEREKEQEKDRSRR